MAQTFESLKKYPETSEEMVQKAIQQAAEIVKGNLGDFTAVSYTHLLQK